MESPSGTPTIQNHHQTFELSSGGVLGYAEYGMDTPAVVFYFHGWPGSRLEGAFLHDAAVAAGVRLIAVDRPGMGLSSFREGRKFMDWPGTLSELAQHLGIKEFSILGFSAAAPYVLACAKTMPKTQLLKAGIIGGRGPSWMGTQGMSFPAKAVLYIYTWLPFALRPLLHLLFMNAIRNPDPNIFRKRLLKAFKTMSEPDRVFLRDDRSETIMMEMIREGFRSGSKGLAYDAKLLGKWDFDIQDVDAIVKLWYGEEDINCPLRMGRMIAEKLPHGECNFFPGEGHISLTGSCGEEMLRGLSE
jgi:pimeloyl-ACP methyl ester carboxylesterase